MKNEELIEESVLDGRIFLRMLFGIFYREEFNMLLKSYNFQVQKLFDRAIYEVKTALHESLAKMNL